MKRFFIPLMLASVVATAFWAASCSEGGIVSSPRDVVFPASNVQYRKHLQPFFDVTCATAGCHSKQSMAGGVSFASYFDFINRAGLVVPQKAEQSLLAQIIDPRTPQAQFHPFSFQSSITQNHIDGVKTWIREGAQFN